MKNKIKLSSEGKVIKEKIMELDCLKMENYIVERNKLRTIVDDEHWEEAKRILKTIIDVKNQLRYQVINNIQEL